jgi:hypothetical protein
MRRACYHRSCISRTPDCDREVEALFVNLRNEPNPQSIELANSMKSYCDIVDKSQLKMFMLNQKFQIQIKKKKNHLHLV